MQKSFIGNAVLCEECPRRYNLDNFKKNIHYFYCKKCIKKINIISKSKSQKIFILDDGDLNNLKYIYSWGSNNFKYYKMTDIEKSVINKHGSFNNLKKLLIKRKKNSDSKRNTMKNSRLNREKEIKEIFKLNKLEFKNYGECYSYINYGKPNIETILGNELKKLEEKNRRRFKLSNELNKLNIPLDETIKACYNYINNIGTKTFNDIVRAIEVEHFLKTHTRYLELCEQYDQEVAKEIAMRNYSDKNTVPDNIIDYNNNKISVCFD
jgi:hypothetical protein